MPNEGLERFLTAQAPLIGTVMAELAVGQKASHWMWFVFPQLRGLGRSDRARHFGLTGADEAQAYARHPVLGPRLRAAGELVLSHPGMPAETILGAVDAMKLRSCATLFAAAAPGVAVFPALLDTFFQGERCPFTFRELT